MAEWIAITDEQPVWGQDVLVYSTRFRGYAVAKLEPRNVSEGMWINSTTGFPFIQPPTHWRLLPAPPELPSGGYESYSKEN